MSLRDVRRFIVSDEVVRVTDEALREAGADGYERFVLWTGIRAGDDFLVRSTHVPTQTAYKGEAGLCVRVDGNALDRFNRWQYEHGETLGIQVHSHPQHAYHSETDDTYPIVTAVGGVSVVVPDFGHAGLRGGGTATYRLAEDGWTAMEDGDARTLVVLGT